MTQSNVYLLRVDENPNLLSKLTLSMGMREIPQYVRLATIHPLSAFGYVDGTEGALISWNEIGIALGVPEDPLVPCLFVPWQNIAYIADGDLMHDFVEFKSSPANAEITFQEFRARSQPLPETDEP